MACPWSPRAKSGLGEHKSNTSSFSGTFPAGSLQGKLWKLPSAVSRPRSFPRARDRFRKQDFLRNVRSQIPRSSASFAGDGTASPHARRTTCERVGAGIAHRDSKPSSAKLSHSAPQSPLGSTASDGTPPERSTKEGLRSQGSANGTSPRPPCPCQGSDRQLKRPDLQALPKAMQESFLQLAEPECRAEAKCLAAGMGRDPAPVRSHSVHRLRLRKKIIRSSLRNGGSSGPGSLPWPELSPDV